MKNLVSANPTARAFMDFWSDNDDIVDITNAALNPVLPSVVVAGLPVGAKIIRVVAMIKIAVIKDSSGADNKINNAAMIVAVDSDIAYGSTVTGINIPNSSWAVDVSENTERGGDVLVGDNDIKAEVTGDGTYYFRFENAQAVGANLKLLDLAVGLRVYFRID